MKLAGKTALVTGGSRGIGRAIALSLAGEGAGVAVNYTSHQSEAEQVVNAIRAGKCDGMAIQADISDLAAVERMIAEVTEKMGPIDILVNNAGIWRGGRLPLVGPEEWDAVLDTNLKGMFGCTRAVLKSMIERRSGKIINISSVIAMVGFPGDTVYASSKAGIVGFTKSLALEVARYGINVNAVAPGIIGTDMNRSLDEKIRRRLADRIPLGILGTPEDVAEVVCFLACGAAYVTGQVWAVDGGYTMMA